MTSTRDHAGTVGLRLLPIAPHDGLYLDCRPAGGAAPVHPGDVHLARVFGRVWGWIPAEARGGMLGHWQALWAGAPAWARGRPCGPVVEALEDWPGQFDAGSGIRVYGELVSPGGHLRFWSVATDAMPDDLLGWLVAHELGHASHAAVGLSFRSLDAKEAFADARADAWTGMASGRDAVLGWIGDWAESRLRDGRDSARREW